MKKQILTILLSLVAVMGQAQIHYRLEGNIGHPEFTGIMYMVDILKAQYIDTIEVVNGNITPKEGDLPEMTLCNLNDTTTILVQTDSVPYTASKLSLSWLFIDKGTTRVEGLKGNNQWLAFCLGFETRLWSIMRLGYNIRYKMRTLQSVSELGEPYFVPGFGKNDNSCFGGSVYLTFDIGKTANLKGQKSLFGKRKKKEETKNKEQNAPPEDIAPRAAKRRGG